jgi:hypothetical protein
MRDHAPEIVWKMPRARDEYIKFRLNQFDSEVVSVIIGKWAKSLFNKGQNMKLKPIVTSEMCVLGRCPTLYQSEDGSFFVQGFVVKDAKKKLPSLPAGETLVRIDPSLLKQIKKSAIIC